MKKDDKYYINQLEHLVCFLAQCHQANVQEFYDKPAEFASKEGRGLNEQEWDSVSRTHQIQGMIARFSAKEIASYELESCPTDWEFIKSRLKKRVIRKQEFPLKAPDKDFILKPKTCPFL